MTQKLMSLDIGDEWTGSALSDKSRILAKPYKTIKTSEIDNFIRESIAKEHLETIIVGYPLTLRGTSSNQTEIVIKEKKRLENRHKEVKWMLWDERLSSKLAEKLHRAFTKAEKRRSHSIAAAFVLQSYLDFCALYQEKSTIE